MRRLQAPLHALRLKRCSWQRSRVGEKPFTRKIDRCISIEPFSNATYLMSANIAQRKNGCCMALIQACSRQLARIHQPFLACQDKRLIACQMKRDIRSETITCTERETAIAIPVPTQEVMFQTERQCGPTHRVGFVGNDTILRQVKAHLRRGDIDTHRHIRTIAIWQHWMSALQGSSKTHQMIMVFRCQFQRNGFARRHADICGKETEPIRLQPCADCLEKPMIAGIDTMGFRLRAALNATTFQQATNSPCAYAKYLPKLKTRFPLLVPITDISNLLWCQFVHLVFPQGYMHEVRPITPLDQRGACRGVAFQPSFLVVAHRRLKSLATVEQGQTEGPIPLSEAEDALIIVNRRWCKGRVGFALDLECCTHTRNGTDRQIGRQPKTAAHVLIAGMLDLHLVAGMDGASHLSNKITGVRKGGQRGVEFQTLLGGWSQFAGYRAYGVHRGQYITCNHHIQPRLKP